MGGARDGREGIVACGISSDSVGAGVSAGGSSKCWWVSVLVCVVEERVLLGGLGTSRVDGGGVGGGGITLIVTGL